MMLFLGLAKRIFSRRQPEVPPRSLRMRKAQRAAEILAKYDAAQTTELNKRYWRNADLLAPDSANSVEVRRTLRSRARYEALEANSYAKGIVHTLANDTIGRGPRLQLLTGNAEANRRIEASWMSWSRRIGLARKLRTMRISKAVDGEAFAILTNNRRLGDVQLDLRLIEADQVSSPFFMALQPNNIDGVVFDEETGEPVAYHVLRQHPGNDLITSNPLDFDEIQAENMLHVFRQDRAGQHRGIPEITTALPLFALLRDYTLAVLHNARSAAKFTAVLETDAGAFDADGNTADPNVEPFDMVDIDYDMITSIPFGWRLNQLKAEQPSTTYEMFRNAILNEIARCVHMPFNVAAANSSKYNYASGRLDHQTYFKSIDVERSEWEEVVLSPLFERWFDEAVLSPGVIPSGLGPMDAIPHQWMWDGHEHVDPQKESKGQETRIANGTTTRQREYARMGLDVDEEDQKAADSYGVSVEEYRAALFGKHFGTGGPSDPDSEADDEEETEDEEAAVGAAAE